MPRIDESRHIASKIVELQLQLEESDERHTSDLFKIEEALERGEALEQMNMR